jgi:hypothetical protein
MVEQDSKNKKQTGTQLAAKASIHHHQDFNEQVWPASQHFEMV